MKTIIRSIDKESHARATALTLALIKGEMHSRTGLDKKKVSNPFYTEDFDSGLLFCEYYQQADLGEKTWHGTVTDIGTDTIFCFEAATLAEVRLQCTRVIKNRFEAEQDEQAEQAEQAEQDEQDEQAEQDEQIVKGRCRVWNDRFLYPDSKMIVSISPSIYKYVAADGTMWKNAERIETSKQALAFIWKSKRQ